MRDDDSDDTETISKESYDLIVDYSFTAEDLGALYKQFTNSDIDKN